MRITDLCSLSVLLTVQACFYNPSGSPEPETGPTSEATTGDPTEGGGGRCGDGTRDPDEQCDLGDGANGVGGSLCKSDCNANICGDGYVANSEGCDDGNAVDDDECSNYCKSAGCGDGVVVAPEECDDGGQPGDACSELCKLPFCGDGVTNAGEACDLGADNGDDQACTLDCEEAVCGDGKIELGVEVCDDGNQVDDDECRNNCTSAKCGDGEVQAPEQCDDGNDDETDDCTSLCQGPSCGDGFVQGDEACDLGSGNGDDKPCTSDCENAVCGDAKVLEGVEACDDGNMVETDACSKLCTLAVCGDGLVHLGVEQCDDGNMVDQDLCTNLCEYTKCGDGVVDPLEECDDGNLMAGDSCDGCQRTAFLVFVTSAVYKGNLGSTSGADERCKERANAEGLPGAGNYKAWISDPDGAPQMDFYKSPLPYIRLDNTVVAEDWADLTNGGLQAVINIDEKGTTVSAGALDCSDSSAFVWTNTLGSGALGVGKHCAYWSSQLPGSNGGVGHVAHVDTGWTANCTIPCDAVARLYCFEQPD